MSYERPKDINTIQVPETARPHERELHRRGIEQQRQLRNENTIVEAGVDVFSGLLKKKMNMNTFSKESIARSKKLNDQVATFGTPYDDFDLKSNSLMNDLVTKHNEISGVLDRGEAKNPNLANSELLKIEGIVDQYAQGITDIMASAKVIEQAMKIYTEKGAGAAGTLSVTGALPPQLNIIDKIRRGGELGKHIHIDHDGTNIILTDLSDEACEGAGGCPVLNLGEFHKALLNENNPYIKLVPDISKELTNAYDSFMKNNKGAYSDLYTEVTQGFKEKNEERIKNGQAPLPENTAQRMISVEKEKQLISNMKGNPLLVDGSYIKVDGEMILDGGMFDGVISSFGESVWEDMMPTGITGTTQFPEAPVPVGDTKEYKEYYKNFKKPMLEYLAEQAIEKNGVDLQRTSVILRTTNKGKNKPDVYNPKGDEYDAVGKEKEKYDENKQEGSNDFYNKGASRLSSKFITTSNLAEDEKMLEKAAKVGDTVVLSNGVVVKRTKSK